MFPQKAKEDNIMADADDFELNDDELAAENQMSAADEQKVKILKVMKKKIEEAIENLNFSEKEEYKANFAVISRYVGAIIEIEQMEADPEISEDDLLEAIEKIEITVKELSFQDLKSMEKKSEVVTESGDEKDDKKTDEDFDF
jgi:hypothetical protein